MRGGSEAVQTKALTTLHTAEAVGPVANDSGTEQRRGFFIREIRRQWVGEILLGYTGFSVAPVDVITGESGLLAEIFGLQLAEIANTIGRTS